MSLDEPKIIYIYTGRERERESSQRDIVYIVDVLWRYLSDTNLSHLKTAKEVQEYLWGTDDFTLTYWQSDVLIGYSFLNYRDNVCSLS
jgi:hypothetical protein